MTKELKIAFVGAGAVNFGGGEGPWDHASRLERIEGLRLVGVADPDTEKAHARLRERSGALYEGSGVFADCGEMLRQCAPDAVWIGVPPDAHGASQPGRDIELRCAEAGAHLFVEKPLSAAGPDEVRRVAEALDDSAVIVSVGYMFRYSLAVERMRELLQQTPGGARAVAARYGCAYSEIRKPFWWDVRRSGGPVVEQATHFLDLARHLAGEADLGSVRAVAIPETSPCAQLSDAPPMPDGRTPREAVPAPFRGPVATAAVWRFTSGAVASLTHGALLHGRKYDCELEVWGDGLRLLLEDPYGSCRLSIRRPGGEETTVETFSDDDPYLTEDAAFVEAVRTGEASAIRSGYADALKTHELAWAIRSASQPPAGQAEA